jgi:GNAT superfamily N-acetyltransferase
MTSLHALPIAPSLAWCHDTAQADTITALFLQQLRADYISHGELQGPRAVAPGQWRDDLPEVVRRQVQDTLALPRSATADRLATAHVDGVLAAIAFVSIDERGLAARRFATLDDFVVDARHRGAGVGAALFDWVCSALREEGVQRVFLESGIGNAAAHGFFEARGCVPVSVTLLKELES